MTSCCFFFSFLLPPREIKRLVRERVFVLTRHLKNNCCCCVRGMCCVSVYSVDNVFGDCSEVVKPSQYLPLPPGQELLHLVFGQVLGSCRLRRLHPGMSQGFFAGHPLPVCRQDRVFSRAYACVRVRVRVFMLRCLTWDFSAT